MNDVLVGRARLLAHSLLQYLQRTGRKSAVIQEIQPNFKVKGQRFSAEELKRLFNELLENSLAVWLDANTIEISPNRTEVDRTLMQQGTEAADFKTDSRQQTETKSLY